MKTYRHKLHRRSIRLAIGLSISAAAVAASCPAIAQTALDSASVSVNADSPSSLPNLRVSKAPKDGGFVITITNGGTEPVTGATVKETIGKGLPCPADNNITFTGGGAPLGSFTLASLISPGIVLGTIPNGQTVILLYSCEAS